MSEAVPAYAVTPKAAAPAVSATCSLHITESELSRLTTSDCMLGGRRSGRFIRLSAHQSVRRRSAAEQSASPEKSCTLSLRTSTHTRHVRRLKWHGLPSCHPAQSGSTGCPSGAACRSRSIKYSLPATSVCVSAIAGPNLTSPRQYSMCTCRSSSDRSSPPLPPTGSLKDTSTPTRLVPRCHTPPLPLRSTTSDEEISGRLKHAPQCARIRCTVAACGAGSAALPPPSTTASGLTLMTTTSEPSAGASNSNCSS